MEARVGVESPPSPGSLDAAAISRSVSAMFCSKLDALCSLACERASRLTDRATSRAGADGGGDGEGAAREGKSGAGRGGDSCDRGGGSEERSGSGDTGGVVDQGRGDGCVGVGGRGVKGRVAGAPRTGRGGGAGISLAGRATTGSCDPPRPSPGAPHSPAVPAPRRWYARDPHGIYHCLLCSYTCERQRTLKTHAWKHAREVTCTYPVFEELEDGGGGGGGAVPTASGSDAAGRNVHPSEDGSAKATSLLSSPGPPKPAEVDARERSATASTPGSSDEAKVPGLPGRAAGVGQGARRSPGPCLGVEAAAGLGDVSGAAPPRLPTTGKSRDVCCSAKQEEQGIWKTNCGQVGGPAAEEDKQQCSQQQQQQHQERDDGSDVRPVSRHRTNSECLRLHSLAAEALVALPAWLPPTPRHPDPPLAADLRVQEPIRDGNSSSDSSASRGSGSQPGISTLLLSVIERLHERVVGDGEAEALTAGEGDLRSRATVEDTDTDSAERPPEEETEGEEDQEQQQQRALLFGGLVEQVSGARHAYRCRVCPYRGTSAGHARQHLRAHRRPQPYQCPICHEVALDCGALHEHTARHCRPRPHHCSHCSFDFHYKSQLRNHEREHHNVAPRRRADAGKHAGSRVSHGQGARERRLHQCDMCSYTSVSYVGLRNHRRIHDKSYRCAQCEFTASSAAAFKQHSCARNAPAASPAEPFRCVLCGYVCSFAASLKAHMWRHASDQNYDFQRVNRDIDAATALAQRFQNRATLKMVPAQGELGKPPCSPGTLRDKPNPALPDGHSPNPLAGNTVTTSATLSVGKPARSVSEKPVTPATPATPAAAVQPTPLLLAVPQRPALGGPSGPQAPQGKSCRLTFCCCVCGFESGVREQLLVHMQDHRKEFLPTVESGHPQHKQQQQQVQPLQQ